MQRSIPVVLVANLKGGVGKTTIAANLAAYFEDVHSERVLAIDLDYQGSLSSMILPKVDRSTQTADHAVALVGGHVAGEQLLRHSYNIPNSSKDSRVIPCAHEFANYETRLVLEWLIGDIGGDIRYNLARVLHDDFVQCEFQRVIIDAPPRITAGFINALCTSTHLLVPTVLDRLSVDGVGSFLKDVNKLKGNLFPRLQLLGVVGNMKRTSSPKHERSEVEALLELKRLLRTEQGSDHYLLEQALIPRKESIARAAGLGIVYPEIKDLIRPLGEAVFESAPPRRELRYESRIAQVAVR
ncbi:MAG: ParA family protein [Hyphomicrobiaceae bacterium]